MTLFALVLVLALALTTTDGAPDRRSHPVFGHDTLKEYHLRVDPPVLAWLNTHELLEEYVRGNVSFAGPTENRAETPEVYKDVGIRYKGSKGSLEFCFSNATGNAGSNEYNKRLCKKLSMKIAFDHYDENARFYDMKKINLHAMMNDPAMMRECLAYGLYRRMGVHVPRCAHAKVYINGDYQGIYLAVEYIDSRFLKHHFGEKNGVLFKEKWPAISQESTHADYFLDGVRNKKSSTTAKDVKPTLKFSQKLWDAETTEDVGHLLRKYWNLDSILNTLVVAMVIDDWDSFFTFFPKDPNRQDPTAAVAMAAAGVPQTRFNHNFYLYQDEEGMLNFIQWDTDLTFSEYGSVLELFFGCPPWNVPLCSKEEAGSGDVHCTQCRQYKPYNVSQGSPVDGMLPGACDKILNYISTEMREEILQRAYYFLSEVFLPEEIAKVVRDWEVLLAPAHATDPNYPAGKPIFPDPSENSTIPIIWKDEVASLLGTIRDERKRALERTNPAYSPRVPDRKNIKRVFKCVEDCSKFAEKKGIKSLYTCYNICLFELTPV